MPRVSSLARLAASAPLASFSRSSSLAAMGIAPQLPVHGLQSHSAGCPCRACTSNPMASSGKQSARTASGHSPACACTSCSSHSPICSCPSCAVPRAANSSCSACTPAPTRTATAHAPGCPCASCTPHTASCSCPTCSLRTPASSLTSPHHRTGCACPSCSTIRLHTPAQLQQVRSMACNARLDRAPPGKIIIEYDPADVEAFIAVADAIETAFPSVVVEGNEDGAGRTGSFEVSTSDGHSVYSKLKDHRYPDPDDLITRIANRTNFSRSQPTDGPVCQ